MAPYLIYIILCLFVAIMGVHRRFGFWGYFFASCLLTPVIGIILVLASDKRKTIPVKQ